MLGQLRVRSIVPESPAKAVSFDQNIGARMNLWAYGSITVAGLSAVGMALAGGLLTEIGPWYRMLRKPSWQPPDWLFGPAWTVILGLEAWSASLAWDGADLGQRPMIVGLFATNAVLHVLWSPLFFKLRRPDWALVEVPLLWLSILALIIAIRPISPLASALLAPYLIWVTFAAYLNLTIVRLNRPFGSEGSQVSS